MLPKAGGVEALWKMLRDGGRGAADLGSSRRVSASLGESRPVGGHGLTMWSRAQLFAKGVGADVFAHERFVPAAYLVDGAERFDAAFWSLSPHEAAIMDPQHRLFLEVAWQVTLPSHFLATS